MNIVDKQLRFVQINQLLAEINELPQPDHIGKTIYEVLPQMASLVEPIYQQVLLTGQPILNQELSGASIKQPNIIRHFLASYFPIPGEDDRPSGVGTVLVEISYRKQVEQELRLANERLQYLLTSSPVVIYSSKTSEDFSTTFISENVKEMVGYEARSVRTLKKWWATKRGNLSKIPVSGSITSTHKILNSSRKNFLILLSRSTSLTNTAGYTLMELITGSTKR